MLKPVLVTCGLSTLQIDATLEEDDEFYEAETGLTATSGTPTDDNDDSRGRRTAAGEQTGAGKGSESIV